MTDLPMTIHFYRSGGAAQLTTPGFCLWWIWLQFSLNDITIDLMAWISIEHHLLKFHANFNRRIRSWQQVSFQVETSARLRQREALN
ncbi:unnamed protein product [Rotaria sp. Silwood2]|nr:unnamed protein product [Rotaria sp. Silwood2]CAF4231030.1 unnamed protein product [Rotaria sp. Silwood2]